jgi:basic membrane lipoprotein Med (substrate-binding protein (PBP1-ABC) superfamily)
VVATPTSSAATADLPLVFGAFTTALEEPWDSAIHAALESAEADGLIRYEHADQLGQSNDLGTALREIIASSDPDIIMGDAFAAEEAVRAVATEFPDIAFAFGSAGSEQAPNFSVFDNWMHDPAYLAGMLAGGLTQTSTIAVIAAMPIPEVNRIVNAFIAGAQQTGPTATVTVSYIDSFYDPEAAKKAADAAIANGADVVFAERDGAIVAAQESGLPAFGMMIDQQADAPDYVVSSLLWNLKPTIEAIVTDVEAGEFVASDLAELSYMANGGSSLAPINPNTAFGIPAELLSEVEAVQTAILDGTFITPINDEAPAETTTLTD